MAERPHAPGATDVFLEPKYQRQSEDARPEGAAPTKAVQPAKPGRKRGKSSKVDPLTRLQKQRRALLARVAYKLQQGDRVGAASLAARAGKLEREIRELTPRKPAKNMELGGAPRVESYTYRGPTGPRRARFRTGRSR